VLFDEGGFNIENTIPHTKNGQVIEKGPKTISSYRFIDMPDWYMEEMKIYYEELYAEKEALEDRWEGGDRQYVFHNGFGKPFYYQHPSKWWKRFCEHPGIRYINFHGLRLSMGTLLIEDEDPANVDRL
jgi:integrase